MFRGKMVLFLVLVLAGVAALGAVSALARGGPPVPVAKEAPSDDGGNGPALHPEDAGGGEVIAQEGTEADQEGEALGTQDVAQAIADEFGVSQEDVLALQQEGIGFGAIFKLYLLSQATGQSVEEILAGVEKIDGKYQFQFGERFRDVELSEDAPKNLGQLVSAVHKSEGAAQAGGGEAASAAPGREHGPPSFAKAHGLR